MFKKKQPVKKKSVDYRRKKEVKRRVLGEIIIDKTEHLHTKDKFEEFYANVKRFFSEYFTLGTEFAIEEIPELVKKKAGRTGKKKLQEIEEFTKVLSELRYTDSRFREEHLNEVIEAFEDIVRELTHLSKFDMGLTSKPRIQGQHEEENKVTSTPEHYKERLNVPEDLQLATFSGFKEPDAPIVSRKNIENIVKTSRHDKIDKVEEIAAPEPAPRDKKKEHRHGLFKSLFQMKAKKEDVPVQPNINMVPEKKILTEKKELSEKISVPEKNRIPKKKDLKKEKRFHDMVKAWIKSDEKKDIAYQRVAEDVKKEDKNTNKGLKRPEEAKSVVRKVPIIKKEKRSPLKSLFIEEKHPAVQKIGKEIDKIEEMTRRLEKIKI